MRKPFFKWTESLSTTLVQLSSSRVAFHEAVVATSIARRFGGVVEAVATVAATLAAVTIALAFAFATLALAFTSLAADSDESDSVVDGRRGAKINRIHVVSRLRRGMYDLLAVE